MKRLCKDMILTTVIVSLSLFCFALRAQDNKGAEGARSVKVIAVKKAPFSRYITATGNLKAKQHSLLCFNVPGTVEEVFVDVGDVVEEGQKLATVDGTTYRLYLAQAEAGLKAAEATLKKVKSGFTKEEVAQAKAAMDAAKATLDKFASGFREEEIKTAEAAVTAAQAAFEQVDGDYQRMKKLLESGAVARAKFEAVEAQWKIAKAQLGQATEQFSMLTAGHRKEDIDAMRAQFKVAEERFKQVQEGFRAEDIEAAEAQVMVQKAALDIARQKVEDTVLKAPYSAVVTGKFLDKGSIAQGPVLEVMDISELEVDLPIPDIYALKVKKGAEVLVDIDGGPKGIRTSVKSVSHKIDPRALTCSARVVLQNVDLQLKAGMFVRAQVAVDTLSDVISVPERAVFEREGRKFVFVVVNGKAVSREILPGVTSGGMVEVKGGLSEGDVVIVDGNFGLREGAGVEIGGE